MLTSCVFVHAFLFVVRKHETCTIGWMCRVLHQLRIPRGDPWSKKKMPVRSPCYIGSCSCARQGILLKKGHIVKNWKRRWFNVGFFPRSPRFVERERPWLFEAGRTVMRLWQSLRCVILR